MKKNSWMRLPFAVILFLISRPFALPAFVNVSPPVAEIVARPGKKIKSQFVVTNAKPYSVTVKVEVKEWWKQQTGLPASDLKQWLSLPKLKPFTLNPGESKPFKYKVRLPRQWSGEAMAMVFFNIDAQMTVTSTGSPVNLLMRHGIPIYVVARNTEKLGAEIKKLELHFANESASSTLSSPLQFSAMVKNVSNVHLRPRGRVRISLGNIPIEETSFDYGTPVFPDHETKYFAKSKRDAWIPGRYRVHVRIDYGMLYERELYVEKDMEFEIAKGGEIKFL